MPFSEWHSLGNKWLQTISQCFFVRFTRVAFTYEQICSCLLNGLIRYEKFHGIYLCFGSSSELARCAKYYKYSFSVVVSCRLLCIARHSETLKCCSSGQRMKKTGLPHENRLPNKDDVRAWIKPVTLHTHTHISSPFPCRLRHKRGCISTKVCLALIDTQKKKNEMKNNCRINHDEKQAA